MCATPVRTPASLPAAGASTEGLEPQLQLAVAQRSLESMPLEAQVGALQPFRAFLIAFIIIVPVAGIVKGNLPKISSGFSEQFPSV